MALEKRSNPPSFRSAILTIASFIALGGYGYYRDGASDKSIQALDLQAKRKIERLEKKLLDLEAIEKEDYERIEALEKRLDDVLRANQRVKPATRLESPAKRE